MDNTAIAEVFSQYADLLELTGANAFRIRAYRGAARRIKEMSEPLKAIEDDPDRKLIDLEGIGKDLAAKIVELITTGRMSVLEEIQAEVPAETLDLLKVPGLGPKKVAALRDELSIESLEQLAAACRKGKVRELKGFGAKTEATILQGIDIAERVGDRMTRNRAEAHVDAILAHMKSCKAIKRITPTGSFRRLQETVGDLDFLVEADPKKADEVMDLLAEFPDCEDILLRGPTKMSIRLVRGPQVDLRVVPKKSYGAALQYFTGSKEHNIVVRRRAKDRGLRISEYGVFRDEEQIAGKTEADVYATIDMPCFPPELREARREFEWIESGTGLPELIELSDIRGDLHMHSTWTDGTVTIEEMALAAKEIGREYIAMTDHSQRVRMVGGLSEDDLRRQWEEVDRINEKLDGITILKGIECDILEKGGLDLSDDCLAEGDWIIASVHFGQKQSRDEITKRVVDALENPNVSAIGHPTGRLLSSRPAYDIDMGAVIETARKNGKCLELNASPDRLDLCDIHLAAAKEAGVPIVISTDSHRPTSLETMRYGIEQARRAGLTKEDVINTGPVEDILALRG